MKPEQILWWGASAAVVVAAGFLVALYWRS